MENPIGLNRINRKDLYIVFLLLILSLPLSILAARIPSFKNYYMNYPLTPVGMFDRAFGLFVTELLFRGFFLFGFSRKFGRWSIIIQDVPYTLFHIGKPILEIPYAAFAGIMFGSINYRSKSFLPSFLVHVIGSEIFIIMVHLL